MARRVLCAGEDDDTCFIVSSLLGREGYEVRSVRSAEEVLSLSAAGGFDLYVLDDEVSGGSGVALCAELRRRDPGTPVIIYSGAAFEADREEALQAGAGAYVPKHAVTKLLEDVRLLLGE